MSKDEKDDKFSQSAPAGADGEDVTDEQLWDEMASEDGGEEVDPDSRATFRVEDDEGDGEGPDLDASAEDDEDESPSDDRSDDEDGDDGSPAPTVEELQAQNLRLQHALESEKGRAASGYRKVAELQRQIEEAKAKPSRSREDDANLEERKQKLREAQEEYGDVIGPLAEELSDLRARFSEMDEREKADLHSKQDEYNRLVEAEREILASEHADWAQTVVSNRAEFDAWVDDQPRYIRDIAAANQQEIIDGTATAFLIGKFKEHLHSASDGGEPANRETDRLQGRRERQLQGARTPGRGNTSQRGNSTRPQADDPDDEKHWDYWRRQEERQAAST